MMSGKELLARFEAWANHTILTQYPNVDIGIADQDMENVAWCNMSTSKAEAGIKLWDTGDYFLQILPINLDEQDFSEFGSLKSDTGFSLEFQHFFKLLENIDRPS